MCSTSSQAFKVALMVHLMGLCSDELLKEFERNFLERDVSESAELISSVFKKNVGVLEFEIINVQTGMNNANFWNYDVGTLHYSKPCVIKHKYIFRFYFLKRIKVLNNESIRVKV
jgi:hypothetical protein